MSAALVGDHALRSPRGAIARLIWLYLRSRRFDLTLLATGGVLLALWWLGDTAPTEDWRDALVLARNQSLLVQGYAGCLAGVVATATWTPFGEPERVSPRLLPLLRLGHVLVLTSVGLAVAATIVGRWPRTMDVDLSLVVVRNTVLRLGLALLAAMVLDARLS